jgi:DNA-binding beta-propeller fold protein YncE
MLVVPPASAATIDTVAGTGQPENNGDAGPASMINVGDPFGVETGPDGALYVTEVRNHRIRRVDVKTRQITTVVGTGRKGYAGDGGPAGKADLNEPYEVRFDQRGNMYFVEMQNHIIRQVDAGTGIITTVAGTGKPGYGGDRGPAIKATFRQPHSIALDGNGNLLVADIGNHRIRLIDLSAGTVDTIAGTGQARLPEDRQRARGMPISGPRALAVEGDSVWIALREGHSVWHLGLNDGTLRHAAGTGIQGYDDGLAATATFNGPKGVAVDEDGNLYVVDTENHVVRKISRDRHDVTTIA